MGIVRHGAIFPEQASEINPIPRVGVLSINERLSIPDTQQAAFFDARIFHGESEVPRRVGEDIIDIHEDRRAKLNGFNWVIVNIHRESAAANVACLLEYGHVDGDVRLIGKLPQVIRG